MEKLGFRLPLSEARCHFHRKWFDSGPESRPILPLTLDSVEAVHEHKRDLQWTSCLAQEERRANAAVKSGQGAAHRSVELPLQRVAE